MITSATSVLPKYTNSTTGSSTSGTGTSGTSGTGTTGTPTTTEPPKGAAEPSKGGTSQTKSISMGKDDFLKLLVAQLKNQDPLNPMDGKDSAAQLAQFSSVEQLMTLNETMASQSKSSAELLTAINELKTTSAEQNDGLMQMIEGQMAIGLVGKTGVTTGNTTFIDRDGKGSLFVDAGTRSGAARVTLTNAKGEAVGTFDIGRLGTGQQAVDLDQFIPADQKLPAGKYTYTVEVATDGGSWQAIKTYTTGRITGLKYDKGNPILTIGDSISLPMSQLTQVRG
jgi:flagellar basal-body rod modification protein FlgD